MARLNRKPSRFPPHPGLMADPPPRGEGRERTMPELLLELFSEEIPARMQRRAAEDLRKLVTDALVERGFLYEGARAYATPRRLALHVVGLTTEVLAEILPSIVRAFPWPKSMRWGAASGEAGSLRWVRPLHAILCTFGPE